jgi:arylsulfatase A-like enzyme
VDEHFGKLLNTISESGILDNTIIIFHADHGEVMHRAPADIYFNHANPYEGCMRVPLLVYVPRISPKRIRAWVQPTDLAPTLLELVGLETSDMDCDGKSLKSLLETGEGSIRSDTAIAFQGFHVVCRGDYKLIQMGPRKTTVNHLYNIAEDRSETKNLYDDGDHLAIRDALENEWKTLAQDLMVRRDGRESVLEIDQEQMEIESEHLKDLGYL